MTLDEVILTPQSVSQWVDLVKSKVGFILDSGITQSEIGTEQCEVKPDGSLTIFVCARNKRIVEMTIPATDWRSVPLN